MTDAAAARHEDHAHRRNPRDFSGVVHGAARQIRGREAGRLRGLADNALDRLVAWCSLDLVDQLAARLDAFLLVGFRELFFNPLPHPLDLAGVEITQFDRKLDAARNDVRRAGLGLYVTDCTN